MVERLSTSDDTLIASYADHIIRYEFAIPHCRGKRVLDAGCGIGYGSAYLARNGAASVTAVDISDAALSEARKLFSSPNLAFEKRDVQELDVSLGQFDVVVNFENIEHIPHPDKLVQAASKLLPSGTLITSTPNGELSTFDANGKLSNEFHIKEFTADELNSLLAPHFRTVTLFGQWLTPQGRLRKLRSRQMFDYLTESYYNPASRIGRLIKRAMGKNSLPPPHYFGDADSANGDYEIRPINAAAFPWQPSAIIAVCVNTPAAVPGPTERFPS